MRITLVISSLNGGGAERVISILANYWAQCRESVTLITLNDDPIQYELEPDVKYQALGITNKTANSVLNLDNFRKILNLRKALKKSEPDVIISFLEKVNVTVLIASLGTGLPVIVSERSHPAYFIVGPVWNLLRYLTYPLARTIVVQTESVKRWFPSFLRKKIQVLANPLTDELMAKGDAAKYSPSREILAVGRLVQLKRFDLLIQAFSKSTLSDWTLTIVGEGPELDALQKLAKSLGVADRVNLPGRSNDVELYYKRAAVFVLCSQFEGFPNVLLEAMAYGRPVISTDCPSGPGDIIQSEVNGLLTPVDDCPALSAALERLAGDIELRKKLGISARKSSASFRMKNITSQWEKLFPEGSPGK